MDLDWKAAGFPVDVYFQGKTPIFAVPDGGPPPEIDRQIAALQIFPANTVKRRTIGPILPTEPFEAVVFLDTLLSYTHQSAELGWLGSGKDEDCDKDERPEVGIVHNIESRLRKAGRELERGDSVKARGELEKLVAKVERIWKRSEKQEGQREGKDRKHRGERGKGEPVIMTSEGYALLKFNTEFLIERLPPIKKKTRNDRG